MSHSTENSPPTTSATSDVCGDHVINYSADNYDYVSVILAGAFGTICKAKDLLNPGQYVAIQKVYMSFKEADGPLEIQRKIVCLKNIKAVDHPNIEKLLDVYLGKWLEENQRVILYLVYENAEQDLSSFIEGCPSPGPAPSKIKDIVYQILEGINFLHNSGKKHTFLTPRQIFITINGGVKVGYYALPNIFEIESTVPHIKEILWYTSPEAILQSRYTTAGDVWSCGCILAELYRTRPLFKGLSTVGMMCSILGLLGCPDEEDWLQNQTLRFRSVAGFRKRPLEESVPRIEPDGLDILSKMLSFSPTKRIGVRDVMNHQYFKE